MLIILPASPATPVHAVSTPEMALCHPDRSEVSGEPQVLIMRPAITLIIYGRAYEFTYNRGRINLPIIEVFMKFRTMSISSSISMWWKSMPEVSISLGMEGK